LKRYTRLSKIHDWLDQGPEIEATVALIVQHEIDVSGGPSSQDVQSSSEKIGTGSLTAGCPLLTVLQMAA
jgi:hypothetical protein